MRSVVLLSGGLDSVVNFKCALDEGEIILAVNFNYGQVAFKDEHRAARACADLFGVRLETIDLKWYERLANNPIVGKGNLRRFTREDLSLPKDELLTQTWLPNRNCVLVSIAAAYAESLRADTIVAGFNREEAEVFPDNSEDFIRAFNSLLKLSTRTKVAVRSFTIELTKTEIVALGLRIGAPLDIVYSCYRKGEGGRMCGECQSCVRLKKAFAENNVLGKFQARFLK